MASDPVIAALRRGFVDYLRKHYGPRAIVRGAENRIVASANPDPSRRGPGDGANWEIFISIVGDRLKLRLWPADARFTLALPDPTMWEDLNGILERATKPVRRWTLPLIEELIRNTFAGVAKITRWQDELSIYPDGPFRGIAVVMLRDRAGEIGAVEIRHGRQNLAWKDRIRVRVDLAGNPEAVREQLIAALWPLPLPGHATPIAPDH